MIIDKRKEGDSANKGQMKESTLVTVQCQE